MSLFDEPGEAEMKELSWNSVQPAYCSKCGDEVTFRAEIDADWTGGEDGCIACPNCGDGTKIMSKARYWGLV